MSGLELEVTRSPNGEHHYSSEETFNALLRVQKIADQFECLRFSFVTNPGGQKQTNFDSYINPRNFTQLAAMMVEADPEFAVKAFGQALQLVSVAKSEKSHTVPIGR